MSAVRPPSRPAGRQRDAARTRAEILDAATEECARLGYTGARDAPVRLAAQHTADRRGLPART
ncbi:hypothetical protein ADK74_25960 [Streptomyces decoyicus]|nr:hypothetical protein ADK74_25960 [Streptomyces decoyicus]QZY14655.1 hypothetical protein K7C20_04800 [Streptomyces decoyicus]